MFKTQCISWPPRGSKWPAVDRPNADRWNTVRSYHFFQCFDTTILPCDNSDIIKANLDPNSYCNIGAAITFHQKNSLIQGAPWQIRNLNYLEMKIEEWPSRAKWGQSRPNVAKWFQTGSNGAKRGQTGPKWLKSALRGQTWPKGPTTLFEGLYFETSHS